MNPDTMDPRWFSYAGLAHMKWSLQILKERDDLPQSARSFLKEYAACKEEFSEKNIQRFRLYAKCFPVVFEIPKDKMSMISRHIRKHHKGSLYHLQ